MHVFDSAIRMEENARDYYETLAEITIVPELKSLFTILADSEQEHYDMLVRMKSNSCPQEAEFKALKDAPHIFQPLLAKRGLMAELQEDPDRYSHAVTLEDDGIKFYEELVSQAEDETIRRLLLMIVDDERKHLNIIENIFVFVESPRSYLAWGVFSNLE